MKLRGFLEGEGLKARSLRAGAWTIVRLGGQKSLQLVSNLILTRLLFPEAFGLMTLAMVFVTGLSLISDVGIRPAVVRSSRSDEAIFQSTAWSLQVVRGFIVMIVAWVFAWPYAVVYDKPELFTLISVAALALPVRGFESIEMIIQERRLALHKVVVLQILAQLIALVATVAFAWWLQSVWALVVGSLVNALASAGLSHILFGSPNHRFSWDRSVLSEILVFGRWILLGTLFGYLGGQGLAAVQGTLVDLDTLAFLAIAGNFAQMILELTRSILGSVVFPALSQIVRERPDHLAATVFRVRRLQLLASIPAFLALSLIAEPLILFLYDPRYAAAGGYLALIALNSALGVIPMIYQAAFLALGDSRIHSVVMGVAAVLRILGAIFGLAAGVIAGMLVGFAIATILTNFLSFYFAQRRGLGGLAGDLIATAVILAFYGFQLSGSAWIS